MSREVICLRTNFYDVFTENFVHDLIQSSGRDVVIIADERRGAFLTPKHIRKISLDTEALNVLSPPDAGWRCGDYTLYMAASQLPNYDYYWIIEPDVRIHTGNLRSFFDGVGTTAQADFVTPWFVIASSSWYWFNSIKPFYPTPYNCMLQVCRFSRAAALKLHKQRTVLTDNFISAGLPEEHWPNDEAFVGAALKEGNMRIADFKEHAPEFRTGDSFSFTRPTSERWLRAQSFNNTLYHPVVNGAKFHHRKSVYLNEIQGLPPERQTAIIAELEEQAEFEPRR